MVDIAVDIGNSRIKWGRCSVDQVSEMVSLPSDQPEEWQKQLHLWFGEKIPPLNWAIASVHPPRRDQFATWLRNQNHTVHIIDSYQQLPLVIDVEYPQQVGIDRLLDAVGANQLRSPHHCAMIVDAGTALTVEFVDRQGKFLGGYILPGLQLMSTALNHYTAKLPRVADFSKSTPIPPKNTEDAIRGGIMHLLLGGLSHFREILALSSANNDDGMDVFFTGGDSELLVTRMNQTSIRYIPTLTLEGIRITAQSFS
jgi:type III pantothenate kinase